MLTVGTCLSSAFFTEGCSPIVICFFAFSANTRASTKLISGASPSFRQIRPRPSSSSPRYRHLPTPFLRRSSCKPFTLASLIEQRRSEAWFKNLTACAIELSDPNFIYRRHLDCYMKYKGQLVCDITVFLYAIC